MAELMITVDGVEYTYKRAWELAKIEYETTMGKCSDEHFRKAVVEFINTGVDPLKRNYHYSDHGLGKGLGIRW